MLSLIRLLLLPQIIFLSCIFFYFSSALNRNQENKPPTNTSQDCYAKFRYDAHQIKKTFDDIFIISLPNDHYAPDISFGIVDLKFDGQTVKICELGECPRSRFNGFDQLYHPGLAWKTFWHFLYYLKLSPLIIMNGLSSEARLEYALHEFEALGGQFASSLLAATQKNLFINNQQQQNQGDYFKDYNAAVMIRNNGYWDIATKLFKQKYPNALILCEALGPISNSKLLTHRLFEHDKILKQFRPRCMVLEKRYRKTLAKKIITIMPCDYFVIKPINSSKGNGIIIVKKHDLFKTLRSILKDKDKNLPMMNNPDYSYWLYDKNKYFLVEEYAPSKLISVNKVQYDATMRIIFILFHDQGKIGIGFVGAYWKLPTQGVTSHASLTDKHKSSIKPEHVGSAKVHLNDYEKVKGILRTVLPIAYTKMLRPQ